MTTKKTSKPAPAPARPRTTRPVIVQEGTQGGLSDEVFDHPTMTAYIAEGGRFGYVGGHHRTAAIDEMVEDALRGAGLTVAEIASYLTWKIGRWLADEVSGVAGCPDAQMRAMIDTFVRANIGEIRAMRALLGASS